jgi:hypothetical protein
VHHIQTENQKTLKATGEEHYPKKNKDKKYCRHFFRNYVSHNKMSDNFRMMKENF